MKVHGGVRVAATAWLALAQPAPLQKQGVNHVDRQAAALWPAAARCPACPACCLSLTASSTQQQVAPAGCSAWSKSWASSAAGMGNTAVDSWVCSQGRRCGLARPLAVWLKAQVLGWREQAVVMVVAGRGT